MAGFSEADLDAREEGAGSQVGLVGLAALGPAASCWRDSGEAQSQDIWTEMDLKGAAVSSCVGGCESASRWLPWG